MSRFVPEMKGLRKYNRPRLFPRYLLLFFLFFLFLFSDLKAQTLSREEILHDRYWSYKERFRKYFTIINDKAGGGLPFSDIVMQNWLAVIEADAQGNPLNTPLHDINTHGKLNVGGDVTAYMAEYLGILSSEYWLLKFDHQESTDEFKAIQNELYFVINAIERLDKYASRYYTGNPTDNIDGFFVRDDSPAKIVQTNYTYEYPKVVWMTSINSQGWELNKNLTPPDKSKFVANYVTPTATFPIIFTKDGNGNPSYYDESTTQSNMNEMSQDQLIGILFGFKCVMKFVDEDLVVDPDGENGPLPKRNLHDWVKELTDKMMKHLTQTTYDVPQYDDEAIEEKQKKMCDRINDQPWVNARTGARYKTYGNCKDLSMGAPCYPDECKDYKKDSYVPPNPKLAAHANYVITNPHLDNDKGVYRGSMAFGFGYPLEKLGEEITGKDYPDVKVTLSFEAQIKRYLLQNLGIIYFGTRESINLERDLFFYGRPIQPHNASWWRDAYNHICKTETLRKILATKPAAGMFIWLPAASGTWTQQQYYNLAQVYHRKEMVMIWAVLNDERPLISATDIEDALISSDCSGPQNTAHRFDQFFNRVSIFSRIASDGIRSEIIEVPRKIGIGKKKKEILVYDANFVTQNQFKSKVDENDQDNEIWYNGMDWMLLYNLYRVSAAKHRGWEPSAFNNKQMTGQKYTYKNNYCPCKSSLGFYKDRNVINGTGDIDAQSRERIHSTNEHLNYTPFTNTVNGRLALGELNMFNENYELLGIHLSDWLTENFSINSGGVLRPKGNLTVCNSGESTTSTIANSVVTIKRNGTLATDVNTNPGVYKVIRFGKNSRLIIENGGSLKIENNTMVLIDEGASLQYNAGARIILNGPNAVLKFNQSVLSIGTNAIFKVEGGTNGRGYVHFHNDWFPENKAVVTCQGRNSNSRFALEGTRTDRAGYYNDKILLVTGNIGLLTDWNLKEFKVAKAFVALGKNSRIISNAEYTHFEHCNINTPENIENPGYLHGGIEIPGRINNFDDVQIWNGINAIAYYNRGNQGRLNINACYFNNCTVPVKQIGGIFKIDNCAVPNPTPGNRLGILGYDNGINAIGMSGNSSLRSSEIGIINGLKHRAGTQSIKYQGTGNLYLWGNKMHSGVIGLFAQDCKLRMKCNTFDYNGWNFRAMRSPLIAIGQGYNKFLNNGVWTHMYNRGQTWVSLLDGFNEFTFLPANPSGLMFDMEISNKSPYNKATSTLYGQNNGYDMRLLDPYTSSSPNQKYGFITYEQPSVSLNYNYLPDIYLNVGNEIANHCTVAREFEEQHLLGFGYPVPMDPMKDYSQSQALSRPMGTKNQVLIKNTGMYTQPATFKSLGNLIQSNFARIYVYSNPANDSAIHELSAALSNNAGRTDLKDSANLVDMYQLYNLLNSAYQFEAFKIKPTDSSEGSSRKIEPFYSEIDNMFSAIWNQSKTNQSVWSFFKREIVTDWAMFNRLANRREKAIDILDSGRLLIEDALFAKGYSSMKCVNQFELMLQHDTALTLDSAMKRCPCILTVFMDEDTVKTDKRDTVIHFCNWEKTPLRKPSYAEWNETGDVVEIKDLNHPELRMEIQPDGRYRLKEGYYRFYYYDANIDKTSMLNVRVVGDTQTVLDSLQTLHYCDKSEYGIYSTATFNIQNLPYRIINDSTGARRLCGKFEAGSYTVFIYDTLNCKIIRKKLLIVADPVGIGSVVQTTLYENTPGVSAFEAFVKSKGPDALVLDNNPMTTISHQWTPCKYNGNYIVYTTDSSSCSMTRYNVTVVGESIDVMEHDTVLTYCDFDEEDISSGYDLSFPFRQLPCEIFRLGEDTTLVFDQHLTEGRYQINYYDTTACQLYRENVTVNRTLAMKTIAEKSIGYCGRRFAGTDYCVEYTPVDSGDFIIMKVYPDTAYMRGTCLSAGKYVVKVYDYDSCKLRTIYLNVYDSLNCSQPFYMSAHAAFGRNDALCKVYPNPAQNMVNIELLGDEKILELRILDITGKLVKLHRSDQSLGNLRLNIQDLNNGVYIIQTVSGTTVYQSKFIISR